MVSETLWHCEISTSACRSLATISLGFECLAMSSALQTQKPHQRADHLSGNRPERPVCYLIHNGFSLYALKPLCRLPKLRYEFSPDELAARPTPVVAGFFVLRLIAPRPRRLRIRLLSLPGGTLQAQAHVPDRSLRWEPIYLHLGLVPAQRRKHRLNMPTNCFFQR